MAPDDDPKTPQMTLDDKVAIVTGAARGIGKATALGLAEAGADVAVFDVRPEVEETAAAIGELGRRSTAQIVDIVDPGAVGAAVETVSEGLGEADILANVAGIVANIAPLASMDPKAWSREIDVNLSGAFHMIQATIGAMVARRWGRIVNVSSVAARGGLSHQVAYSASKSGLLGLARNVAIEHGADGVTCNTILPGFVETETVKAMPGGLRDGLLSLTPVGRFGAVEEVAALIRFLCGADSGYINGAEIDIDGGFRLCPVSLASRTAFRWRPAPGDADGKGG
jgi:NAD(P)-dependent dehydrogenase (short-subunit alcohol dehydrogenase family)